MDVPRHGVIERKRRNRLILGTGVVLAVAAIAVVLARLEPAAPTVDRGTVWLGTVQRGPMVREVRGSGTLVPEEVRWIVAASPGRVERRLAEPGTQVRVDSVVLQLSNPELEQAALDAAGALTRAEAELASLRLQLESQRLDHEASTAGVASEHLQAELRAQADRELARQGLQSQLNVRLSEAAAEALATRLQIERRRLDMLAETNRALLDAKRAEVEQRRTMAALRRAQLEDLAVRAGLAGVVQEVPVEVGQQVAAGAPLARVAAPEPLEAELRVPATQARDVLPGQPVSVDTRNGLVEGTVRRVDPAVREGTVMVEVALVGELPRGARPDLNVDGIIRIERLEDVLHVQRPAYGAEGVRIGLFRLEPDGRHARRVSVELGRASATAIEVLSGLAEGDEVILSDTSRWDEAERIRLD